MRFWKKFVANSKYLLNKNNIRLIITSGSVVGLSAIYYAHHTDAKLSAKTQIDPFEFDFLDKIEDKSKECSKLIKRYKEEYGIPGIIVAVSKNGKTIYSRGFGYSDVENNVKASPHTVVRIASISKPITCTLAAKLFENGVLDIDKPVSEYLKEIPPLKWNNIPVKITARQLMSHTSGIRHYKAPLKSPNQKLCDSEDDKGYKSIHVVEYLETLDVDSLCPEFFCNKNFRTTRDALEIFINDPLLFEPGKGYLYTTFGFTLLSAVMEKCASATNFSDMLLDLFKTLDMNETYLDFNNPLITYRSKYYLRNSKNRLTNVPHVDNSYKWAGGGILSTVGDLLKYGNHLLNSYQNERSYNNSPFLKPSTLRSYVWAPQSHPPEKKNVKSSSEPLDEPKEKESYGLGWHLCHNRHDKLKYVYHTGGAVGATSCLLIVPTEETINKNDEITEDQSVNGVVVAILCNLQDVSDTVKLSHKISKLFSED